MEDSKSLTDTASTSSQTKISYNSATLVVLCLLLSILSGAASGWWFSKQNTHEILVVDVKKIVDDKKKELLEQYKKNPTNETAQAIDIELSEFLRRLDYRLSNPDSERELIILREVVLSGEAADITEEVSRFANQK